MWEVSVHNSRKEYVKIPQILLLLYKISVFFITLFVGTWVMNLIFPLLFNSHVGFRGHK